MSEFKSAPSAHEYICRIIEGNVVSRTVGVGFVVDDRHILTCAHVVNRALGRDVYTQAAPSPAEEIYVDFPHSRIPQGQNIRTFRVAPNGWKPPPADLHFLTPEFAGLEIATGKELPTDAGFAPLINYQWIITERRDQVRMALYGYPNGRLGTWARGRFAGIVDRGMLQFEGDSAVNPQAGFSGSPLIVENSNDGLNYVVGILAFAGSGADRNACCVSIMDVWRHWPQVRTPMIRTLTAHTWHGEVPKETLLWPDFQLAPSIDSVSQRIAAGHRPEAKGEVIGIYRGSRLLSSLRISSSMIITTSGLSYRSGPFSRPFYIPYEKFPSYSISREYVATGATQSGTKIYNWKIKVQDAHGKTLFSLSDETAMYDLLNRIHDLMRWQQENQR